MDIPETAAILDAILNFSKRSRVHRVHPADSERVDPGLPKSMKKKLSIKFPGSDKKFNLATGLVVLSPALIINNIKRRHSV